MGVLRRVNIIFTNKKPLYYRYSQLFFYYALFFCATVPFFFARWVQFMSRFSPSWEWRGAPFNEQSTIDATRVLVENGYTVCKEGACYHINSDVSIDVGDGYHELLCHDNYLWGLLGAVVYKLVETHTFEKSKTDPTPVAVYMLVENPSGTPMLGTRCV